MTFLLVDLPICTLTPDTAIIDLFASTTRLCPRRLIATRFRAVRTGRRLKIVLLSTFTTLFRAIDVLFVNSTIVARISLYGILIEKPIDATKIIRHVDVTRCTVDRYIAGEKLIGIFEFESARW